MSAWMTENECWGVLWLNSGFHNGGDNNADEADGSVCSRKYWKIAQEKYPTYSWASFGLAKVWTVIWQINLYR